MKVNLAVWLLVCAVGFALHAAPDGCVDCHTKSSPTLVTSWLESRHAAKGVGCAGCHGDNHSAIFATKGEVSAAICGKCHATQLKEFSTGLHAVAMDTMKSDPRFSRLSADVAQAGCIGCHQIGKRFPDGSQGKCNSCHSGHAFSVAEARRPESCAQCHTGPDHPQFESWQTSKHGHLFASEATRAQAPTCVTCHMPGGSHNTALGLTLGTVANGAAIHGVKPPVKMRSITIQESERQRESMLKTCLPCHSSRFATEGLSLADRIKREADALLGDAAAVVAKLQSDGLLKPPLSTARNLTDSPYPPNVTNPQPTLVSAVDPVYDGLSPIEQRFLNMARYHHATTFKGAYHQSPLYSHNHGFLLMKQAMDMITHENAELRARFSKQ